jgi:putative endonuclease
MRNEYITYVLQSKIDNNFYVGYTTNLNKRLTEHNSGKVQSTNSRRPLKVIYYEVCFNQTDALHREKYLKSSYGKRYIKNRLKNHLCEER